MTPAPDRQTAPVQIYDDPAVGPVAADVGELMRALAVDRRLEVLRLLAARWNQVQGIADELGMPASTVESHLKALANAGLPAVGDRSREDANKIAYHAVRLLGRALKYRSAAGAGVRSNGGKGLAEETPEPPLACTVCDNSGFVSGVLDDLRAAVSEARDYHGRIQEMSSQVLTAHEAERKRIARELHDDTAQAITSMLVRLRLLERSTEDAEVQKNVQELRELTAWALDSVRRMAMDLRPAALDDLGLVPAVQAFASRCAERWQIEVPVTARGLDRRLPNDIELVLYRVVQEALTNVVKHAAARRAEVTLSRKANVVTLTVADDGKGFEKENIGRNDNTGLGLFGMRERLALVGGELEVCSTSGKGTTVTARVPLPGVGKGTRRAK